MSLTKRIFIGSVALGVALAGVFTAQPSQAMTFSFPGSSNNNSFSFVVPQVPQVLRQEFTGTASYSFGNLIPPSIQSFSFGGSSYGYQLPHANGSYVYNQPSQNTYSYSNGGYSSGSGSSYSYGTGSTSGSGNSSGSNYSYGNGGYSSGSGSNYSYGTGSSSGSGSSSGGSSTTGGSSSGSSSSGSGSSSEDNADGTSDVLAVAKTTSGASVVNLMLNGQLTQGNNLPYFMNGYNPFSYWLVKGKPNGSTLKTMYNFNSSSNAFSLKTCNPYSKPFNWSVQINPSSIPQNLVLMSTPQVTGGQTCSAGAIGSCKKPTQICYYADSYTAPSTLALSSSAPSWTVNMCSVHVIDILSDVILDDGSCTTNCQVAWSTMPRTPGNMIITGPVNKTLPLSGATTTKTLCLGSQNGYDCGIYLPPGTFNYRYDGTNGPIGNGDGYTYYFLNMQVNDEGPYGGYNCNQTSYCVTNGLPGTYNCVAPQFNPKGDIYQWALGFTTSTRFYNYYQSLTESQKASLAKKWMAQAPLR